MGRTEDEDAGLAPDGETKEMFDKRSEDQKQKPGGPTGEQSTK